MSHLPIYDVLDEIFDALKSSPQVILSAPPGAGKSTYLPHILLEKWLAKKPIADKDEKRPASKIILLEPRRLAARNIAHFLAKKRGEQIGQTIGLRIRGETRVSQDTRLEVVTEGVLTRMLQTSPSLDGISLILFDEFHERSLDADLSLALCLDVQAALRDDLRLLIMSATLDNKSLKNVLPDASTIVTKGREYPVSLCYQPLPSQLNQSVGGFLSPTFFAAICQQIVRLMEQEEGSALVFLPGEGEIKKLAALLETKLFDDIQICPLYGKLSLNEQQKAIEPAPLGMRKIVLATNIAETSLTIEGIRIVVDLGLEKVARYQRKTGITKLETRQISRASAIQRMGRAGRVSEGVCLRLYSQETFERMNALSCPEILNADLTQMVMELTLWGCEPDALAFLDKPEPLDWQQARAFLIQLGCLDKNNKLTLKGKAFFEFGTSSRLASLLHEAVKLASKNKEQALAIQSDACWLVAFAEMPTKMGDSVSLYDKLKAISRIKGTYYQRAKQLAKRLKIELSANICGDFLPFLAASAWPDRIGYARGAKGHFLLANGHGAVLDTQFPLSDAPFLIAADLIQFGQGESQITTGCELDITMLIDLQPALFSTLNHIEWDEKKGELIAEEQLRLGALIIRKTPIKTITADMHQTALLAAIEEKGLSLLSFNDKAKSLLVRAQCAKAWQLNIDFPCMSEKVLLASLSSWLAPFMQGVKNREDLKKIDLYQALEARIGWDVVKELNQLLPETYQVPTGNTYPIRYQVDKKPILSVRLQEMYGETQSPCIGKGSIPLLLELLSPAKRPLQVTQDLGAFWQGSYKEVQKEMKGRYPKHVWPDDPAHHQPTTFTKRHFKSNS